MPEQPLQHDDLSELLSAYLDGELTAEEQALVERRLGESTEFRRLYDDLRSLRSGFEALPREQLGPDFAQAVLRQAERAMLATPALKPAYPREEDSVSLAAAPWAKERLVRILRASRWSLAAIAVALLLMIFNPEQKQKNGNVAMLEKQAGRQAADEQNEHGQKDSGDGEMIAVPKVDSPAAAARELAMPAAAAPPEANALRADKGEARSAPLQANAPLAAPAAPAEEEFRAKGRAAAAPADIPSDGLLEGRPPRHFGRAANDRHAYSVEAPKMPALQGKLSASQESGRPLAAARKSPSPVAEVGETLIVECQISAEAVKSHAFEQLLATQQIDLVAAEGPGEAARFAARDEHQEVTAAAPSEEAFLVEAAPEQIAATLVELQSRGVEFPSVTIQSPAKEKAAEEPAAKPLAQAGAQQTAARRGRAVRVESDALTLKKAEEAKAGGRGEPASTSGKRETPLRQSASEATAPATQRVLFLLRVVPQAEPSR